MTEEQLSEISPYDLFKLIHSELIMSAQYIEQDLKIIYLILCGNTSKSIEDFNTQTMGKTLHKLHKLDKELGYCKIKEDDYMLLDEVRDLRNYWCHQCYLDFHYIDNSEKHHMKFLEILDRLKSEELKVYELQCKMEKLRKSVMRKHKSETVNVLKFFKLG